MPAGDDKKAGAGQEQRALLLSLLREMFQLNQPDLDFGLYRVMHAKADRVNHFLEEEMPDIIAGAFPETSASNKTELAAQETSVYDHLHRFFKRYYSDGDFISRRYSARETKNKAAPYAIPYDGREVYLHWANRDQHYIKTTSQLTDFEFDLAQSPDLAADLMQDSEMSSLPVACRLVDAQEGEHGNVKETGETKRFFVLHDKESFRFETREGGGQQLIIQFEYRVQPQYNITKDRAELLKKLYGARNKRDLPLLDMAEQILSSLPEEAKRFQSALSTAVPTDSIKKRPLLAKYLYQYTAPNTSDYFIHKDLGTFLRRELDFYIKNEIINLDELEEAQLAATTERLAMIAALRKIAHHLIDFLAQLEEFQRKLWLKKKFVIETQYCITLDRIKEEHYSEIAQNQSQHQEWLDLFAIDSLDGYSSPLTPEFLKANNKLPIDTRFFSESMRDSIVSQIDFSQAPVEGTLISSENSQALRLLVKTYGSSLPSIYIDPPYNTNASSIIYKNGYKSSSWLSLMLERIEISEKLLGSGGIICIAIDDVQFPELRRTLLDSPLVDLGVAAVRSNPAGRKSSSSLSSAHEYALFFGKGLAARPSPLPPTKKRLERYPEEDAEGHYSWSKFVRSGSSNLRSDRPRLHYPIVVNGEKIRPVKLVWHADRGVYGEYEIQEPLQPDDEIVYPHEQINGKTIERRWERGWEKMNEKPEEYCVRRKNGAPFIYFKTRIDLEAAPTTWWGENEYASSNHGTKELKQLFGEENFDFPKAVRLVEDCIHATSNDKKATILDYFAGSGTTPHAVINLNRRDGGRRKYIAVEMGRHFDDVIIPRVKKIIYSQKWKGGKPVQTDGEAQHGSLSHTFKYLRLESYEDTLNNLAARSESVLPKEASKGLKRDYLLKYCLDYETRESASLLNLQDFDNPKEYKLKIKNSDHSSYSEKPIDLIETFNYLIGLHVESIEPWASFDCEFAREKDPELPKNADTKILLRNGLRQLNDGKWQFRKIKGHVLPTPGDDSLRQKVLVIWRVLTGNLEEDNAVLDEWFKKNCINKAEPDFDTVYVNGSSNLACLRSATNTWKVRLIEEHFHNNMWDLDN